MRKRFLVSGRVQGVGYRNFARHYARKIGLAGYAANLADGSVEVEAEGTDAALRQFEVMLRRGPPLARVATVVVSEAADGPPYPDFRTR